MAGVHGGEKVETFRATNLTKDDPVGTFTVTEALGLLVPIWLGLLYTLVTYGIPDY